MDKRERKSLYLMLFLTCLVLGVAVIGWRELVCSVNQCYLELTVGKLACSSTRLNFWLSSMPWTSYRARLLLVDVIATGFCLVVIIIDCRLLGGHYWFALGRDWRWRWIHR